MFGDSKEIVVRIPYPKKEATVRLPSNLEIAAYLDAYNKKKKVDVDDKQPDVDLFNKLRSDKGEDFDEYECSYIVNNLLSSDVKSCEKEGDEYTVTVKTPFGETVHTLRPPSIREMSLYRSGTVSQDPKASRNSSVKLYDTLMQRIEGYATDADVSLLHKMAVISRIYIAHVQIDPIQADPNV